MIHILLRFTEVIGPKPRQSRRKAVQADLKKKFADFIIPNHGLLSDEKYSGSFHALSQVPSHVATQSRPT